MESIEAIKYNNSNVFLNEIANYVDAHHFGHYLFITTIDRILSGQENIRGALTINRNKNVEIICMLTDKGLYLYGEYSCKNTIETLIRNVDFKIAYKTGLLGGKAIIEQILSITKLNLQLEKHRLFYAYRTKINPKTISKGDFAIAKNQDLKELSELAIDFYTEEFRGKGIKTNDQVLEGIISGLEEKMIFVWRLDNELVSYLQIIDDRNNNFMIGSVFTKELHRNHGFGKSLIHKKIQHIQRENKSAKFGFMVHHDNIASIKMFSGLGFVQTYETGIYL